MTGVALGLLRDLRRIVGPGHLLTEPSERAGYEVDWTGRFRGEALAVVRPGSTAEVASVLAACHAVGIPVVPQGGNTGLVGGGVPSLGCVLVSLRRLTEIESVDATAGQVTAGAGVSIAAVARQAANAGWEFGVDFAARDAATVGGAIATNAGGIRVLRHGSMGAQVVGFEAVLADGRVISRLPGHAKEVVGYDLGRLLAGSEGTLAVVTRARLRLVQPPGRRALAWVAVGGLAAAVALGGRLRRDLAGLEALELLDEAACELATGVLGAALPVAVHAGAAILVEVGGGESGANALAEALAGAPEVLGAAVATDDPGRRRLWKLRELLSAAVNPGVPHKLDVVIPHSRLATFGERLGPLARSVDPATRVIVWGHLAEGNLHVNLLGLPPDDEAVDDAVLHLVLELGGSIGAEHGIGRAKARWLNLARDPVDIAVMRRIKAAFDPAGLLNPGVLFDANGR